MIEGEVTAFDCIEFNPELRWIDTISEAAFVAMDLHARGYPAYCWRFINRYLEISADYEAVKLLRYYFIYRALVRAKVEALQVEHRQAASANVEAAYKPALDYIELADRWANRHRAGLIVMHGLSGSGKSTVAAQLVEALGAIQIRSDVMRKQLFGIDLDASSGSGLDDGIYHGDATALTYRKLEQVAATIIAADYCVIVDATFLREAQRKQMTANTPARTDQHGRSEARFHRQDRRRRPRQQPDRPYPCFATNLMSHRYRKMASIPGLAVLAKTLATVTARQCIKFLIEISYPIFSTPPVDGNSNQNDIPEPDPVYEFNPRKITCVYYSVPCSCACR